jgi:hypothetical protein
MLNLLQNPFSENRVVIRGRTDRRDKANSRFFLNYADVSKSVT